MSAKENEILLIRAFKEGNEKAFKTLFDRYHKKLYVYLYRLLKSKEDAEEIVQDTFIKIWEKREEFMVDFSFDSFLFKIAKNSFISLTRRKVNKAVLENHPDIYSKIDTNNSENYLIFKETTELVNSIIEELPVKRKEIFQLRRIENMSRKEIAEKLGVSIITVDNQLTKANSYLKDKFKKYGVLFFVFFIN